MATLARKLIFRELKLSRHRKYSSAALKNDDNFVVRSRLPDVVIPNMRVLDRMWVDSAGFQNHVALEDAESTKSYTYSQLQKNMAVFATSLLKKLGLQNGDVVAAMIPNSPEFAVVAFGALQAGCVLTTINPIYKEYEVCHQVSLTEPKLMVTVPECYDTVVKGLKEAKNNSRIVLIDNPSVPVPDGVIRFSQIAETGDADYGLLDKVERRQDDVAFIPFSSGTTGLPKGVEISHKNLLATIDMMGRGDNCYPQLTHGDYQDVLPCLLPFFHIYGLVITLLGHLTKGSKLITISKFTPTLYLDVIKQQNPTLLYIVPPIAVLLGKHPDVKKEHFTRVRHVVCGAAPLAASDADAVLEKCQKKLEFNQGYGATETTSCGTATFKGAREVDYSACGQPMAGVSMKFVDPQSGKAVPIGESGELYIRGPLIMKRYHKNEKATKETITEDGYFKTGDLGRYNPEKGLYITDRIKELIKVKGMQVAPAELESLLRTHPAVSEAAVIGVPHDIYGETPKAFIIKKKDLDISSEAIQDFVAEKVAPFKKIREVVFVDSIPKTSSGKILRRDLKNM